MPEICGAKKRAGGARENAPKRPNAAWAYRQGLGDPSNVVIAPAARGGSRPPVTSFYRSLPLDSFPLQKLWRGTFRPPRPD